MASRSLPQVAGCVSTWSSDRMGSVTLDLLSEGRFVLGLGIGHRTIVETWHGIPFTPAGGRLREYVELRSDGVGDPRSALRGTVRARARDRPPYDRRDLAWHPVHSRRCPAA